MKKYLLIALVFSIHFVSAQVGINTTTPENTLDVNGSTRVRDMEEVTNPDDEKSKYVVTADENGVLTKVDKSTFNNLLSTKALSSAVENLSTDSKIYDGYLFDGSRNNTITLPKAKNGASIFFYAWGGTPARATTYTFVGSAAGKLAKPSASIRNYPPGVDYGNNANGRLVLTSPRGDRDNRRGTRASFRFRYTKIEFICFGDSWYYVHNDPR